MNKTNKTTTSTKQVGGISFTSLLAILFIGLKLTGVINWSVMGTISNLDSYSYRTSFSYYNLVI